MAATTPPGASAAATDMVLTSRSSISASGGKFALAVQISIWFGSAVLGTIVNKQLMKVFPYPIVLSVLHLAVGICMDYLISLQHNSLRKPFPWHSYVDLLPAACTLIGSRVLTYVSYGQIPASLTHTIKASAPIFSVFLSRFYLKHVVKPVVVFSLIPIIVGVTLSSVTDLEFEWWGFVAAMTSTMVGSLQNVFTKHGLVNIESDPVILHLRTSVLALVMAVPAAILTDIRKLGWPTSPPGVFANDVGADFSPDSSMFIAKMLVFSVFLQYIQTMGSLFVLSGVSAVTHQVSATLKRLVIIVCTIIYFGNSVQFLNYVGIVLALSGFFFYGIVSSRNKSKPTMPTTSGPLLPTTMSIRNSVLPTNGVYTRASASQKTASPNRSAVSLPARLNDIFVLHSQNPLVAELKDTFQQTMKPLSRDAR